MAPDKDAAITVLRLVLQIVFCAHGAQKLLGAKPSRNPYRGIGRGRSVFRRTSKAESRGHCHQIGERVGLHFSDHLTSGSLHRDLADADIELATDLFIQQANSANF